MNEEDKTILTHRHLLAVFSVSTGTIRKIYDIFETKEEAMELYKTLDAEKEIEQGEYLIYLEVLEGKLII